MSVATSKVGGSFSNFVDRFGSSLKAGFEQALSSSLNSKAQAPAGQKLAASGSGPRSSGTFIPAQLSSLFSGSVQRAPVLEPFEQTEKLAPKIKAEPSRIEENFLVPNSVLHPFRVEGSDGKTFCRVEVDTNYNTTTVYDNANKTIVHFDSDGDPKKGEAWKDEYNIIDKNVVLKDNNISIKLITSGYPSHYLPDRGRTTIHSTDIVQVIRSEEITYIEDGKLIKAERKDGIGIFGLTDKDVAQHPDRNWSGEHSNVKFVVPFSAFNNLGYAIESRLYSPTVIGKASITPLRAE